MPDQKSRHNQKFKRGGWILPAIAILIAADIAIIIIALALIGYYRGAMSGSGWLGGEGTNGEVAGGLCENVPEPYKTIFGKAGGKWNVQPAFIAAIFYIENGSSWRNANGPWPTSPKGAKGPFQFMPATWESNKQDGNGDGVMDINNIWDASFAAAHLLAMIEAGGNTTDENKLTEAAAKYNGGNSPPSSSYRVYAKKVIDAYRAFLCQPTNAVVTADGHTFPLERNRSFPDTWLADRCSGTGSGRPHAHGGIDIMHTKDDKVPVYAVVNGNIYRAASAWIRLQSTNPNDRYTYFYQHLSSVLVRKGQSVKVGQLIGYSGGYSAGAQGDHTHFGMMTCPNNTAEVPISSCRISTAERERIAASQTCLVNPYPSLKIWYNSSKKDQ